MTIPRPSRIQVIIGVAIALTGVGLATGVWWLSRSRVPQRIILIVVDTLRRDHLSCYGSAVLTPNIDQLAATGRRYDNLVASFHQTTMSMAAMFTGLTPSLASSDPKHPLPWNGKTWCGLSRFANGADPCIPPQLPTLATALHTAGYWTIGIASNELLFKPAGYDRGFDDWREVGRLDSPVPWTWRASERVNAATLRALDERRSDRFFLYVHYMDVHDYESTGRSYTEAVGVADTAIGGLLEALRHRQLLDHAVVIVTADHGERLGEKHALEGLRSHMGNPSFETVLQVPLIVWPRGPTTTADLIRTADLPDLITGLLGVSLPRERVLAPNELFLTEFWYLTYRQARWKSFLRLQDGNLFLFDLSRDPQEQNDVAAAHPDIASAHRERMLQLATQLSTTAVPDATPSDEDRARLHALGYLH